MAAVATTIKTKITLGVGGYKLPPALLKEATETEAVVSFLRGREGNTIGRAADGKVVLPARNAHLQPLPGEVWRGKIWLHSSRRFYIFEPHECIVAKRQTPEFVTVATPVTTLYFVRVRDATDKAKVIVVSEKSELVAGNIIVHMHKLAEVARRFEITNTVTYGGVLERISNLKLIYGAERVRVDYEKLKQLFRDVEESGKEEQAHDHKQHAGWFIQPDPRDKEGKTAIMVEQCRLCGWWTVKTLEGRSYLDRLVRGRVPRGSRFTPKRKKPARARQNLSLRQKGMHRRKVVHARKRRQGRW